MKKVTFPLIKKTNNVRFNFLDIILVYDKLSCQDVFDFDNYLKQFEGPNRDFMGKLVKT
jgi:hypothetical protein